MSQRRPRVVLLLDLLNTRELGRSLSAFLLRSYIANGPPSSNDRPLKGFDRCCVAVDQLNLDIITPDVMLLLLQNVSGRLVLA